MQEILVELKTPRYNNSGSTSLEAMHPDFIAITPSGAIDTKITPDIRLAKINPLFGFFYSLVIAKLYDKISVAHIVGLEQKMYESFYVSYLNLDTNIVTTQSSTKIKC